MSEEYTVIHQWDKVRGDFKEVMTNPYKYVETELKKLVDEFGAMRGVEHSLPFADLKSVVDMLETLNTIYTPEFIE